MTSTGHSWDVGPMERDAAEVLLRKQQADAVKVHSLPFLVRQGNKGLTLTSEPWKQSNSNKNLPFIVYSCSALDASGRMGHVPIEGSVVTGFAVNQANRRVAGTSLHALLVSLGLLPAVVCDELPSHSADEPLYDHEAPTPLPARPSEPIDIATYTNMASLPLLTPHLTPTDPSYAELGSLPSLKTCSSAESARRTQRVSSPAWLINERDLLFEDNKILGAGASGEVRCARWRGSLVAVKQLSGAHKTDDASALTAAFHNELARMHKLPPHPNVTSFFGSVMFESGAVAAVLELCADGALVDSLYGASCKKNDWQLLELLEIAHDCACGLQHLHEYLIVHRDLAARNVLLTSGSGRKLFAKLCDLGLSRLLADRDSEQMTVTPEVDSRGAVIRREWLAPEQITSSFYSLSSDVFAFGVVLFEIFARQAPWAHLAQLPNSAVGMRVLRGERLQAPEAAPPAIRTLMLAAWDALPQRRPPIGTVRQALAKEIANRQ
jgi:serine/threonine protein kinase